MGENSSQDSDLPPFRRDDLAARDFARSIGAEGLAKEIEELRVLARLADIDALRNHYLHAVDIHQMKEDRLLDDIKSIEAENLSQSVTYNNVVAGFGYAGFVGLLAVLRPLVAPQDFIFTAILLGLSLLIFVVWTTLIVYLFAQASIRIAPLFEISEDDFDRREIIDKFQIAQRRRRDAFAALHRFWGLNFAFGLMFGVCAAVYLILSLVFYVSGGNGSLLFYLGQIMGFSQGVLT
jgi:hypothetical protein